jgi:hypothetical protein
VERNSVKRFSKEDCQVYLARIGTKLKILQVRTPFSSLRPLGGKIMTPTSNNLEIGVQM